MKTSFFKALSVLVILSTAYSCSDSENSAEQIEESPCDAHFITDDSGTTTSINPGQTNETATIAVYIIDGNQGSLTEKVNLYVKYIDNNSTSGNDNSTNEVFLKSFLPDEFQTNEQDPKAVISFELQEVEDVLNIDPIYTPGDVLVFRLELVLTDGRIFTASTQSSNESCGALDNSSFIFEMDIFCPIEDNIYTGMYTVTSVEPGVLGIPVWQVGTVVEIEIEDSPMSRVFNIWHLPNAGGPFPQPFKFNIHCGHIIVDSQPTGLTCPDGDLFYGPAPDGSVAAFDPDDDSTLTITFTDNELGVCEDEPKAVSYTHLTLPTTPYV